MIKNELSVSDNLPDAQLGRDSLSILTEIYIKLFEW